MSRRKQPVTTKAQREAMAEDWVKLREKIGDRMREAHEAHMITFGALLNLELLFGQLPQSPISDEKLREFGDAVRPLATGGVSISEIEQATRQSIQPAKPPASNWRSMASAPRDGSSHLAVLGASRYYMVRIGYWCADGAHWRSDDGLVYGLHDMLAWAPIPEWTGEVSE